MLDDHEREPEDWKPRSLCYYLVDHKPQRSSAGQTLWSHIPWETKGLCSRAPSSSCWGRLGSPWAWLQTLRPFPPSAWCASLPERALGGRNRGLHTHQPGPWWSHPLREAGSGPGVRDSNKVPSLTPVRSCPSPRNQPAYTKPQRTHSWESRVTARGYRVGEVWGGDGMEDVRVLLSLIDTESECADDKVYNNPTIRHR